MSSRSGRVGGLGPAAGVLAAQDPVVLAARDPALQLGGADGVHRMGERQRAEHLVDHVEPLAARGVLVRLLHERVDVELPGEGLAAAAAGHLHVEPLRRHDVLGAEQAGAVGGELRLPGPLEEGEPDRKHRQAGEHRQRAEADQGEDRGDGAVERVPADHVAQLVGQQHPQLVVVEQLERGRVDHDERWSMP